MSPVMIVGGLLGQRASVCGGQPQVGFRGEADINRKARLIGSVENDPGCVKRRGWI
jgi:hypothetical protein